MAKVSERCQNEWTLGSVNGKDFGSFIMSENELENERWC